MKKALLATILMSLFLFSNSQKAEDIVVQKIRTFLMQSNYDYSVYYNRLAHSLSFGSYVFLLEDVHIEYSFENEMNCVSFSCKRDDNIKPKDEMEVFIFNHSQFGCSIFNKECILDNHGQPTGCVNFGFANKDACYRLINLIADLRDLTK